MELNEYAKKLVQIIKDVEGADTFCEKLHVSKTEYRLLREVAIERESGKDIISSELARRLNITRSAVSQLVGKLEEKGVVVRASSPVDKKIAYIRLSPMAIEVYEEQCQFVNAVLERAAAKLGQEKVENFFAMYDEFLKVLRRARRDVAYDMEVSRERVEEIGR